MAAWNRITLSGIRAAMASWRTGCDRSRQSIGVEFRRAGGNMTGVEKRLRVPAELGAELCFRSERHTRFCVSQDKPEGFALGRFAAFVRA